MRVLTFMSLGESTSEVSFDDLCKELNIGTEEIEDFIIEGLFPVQDGFDPRNVIRIPESGKGILACEQALQGAPAAGRESLQLRLWNLNICIQKVDAKC